MDSARNPGKYREVKGNLIELALQGRFDVITHGCNCMCTMQAGIAPQMAKAFGCDTNRGLFDLERPEQKGNINKLGCIEGKPINIGPGRTVLVVNSYTQYNYGRNHIDGDDTPLDYDALALCLKKINHKYKGMSIGLPKIGCGLAGGKWYRVSDMIRHFLKDMDVTIVTLP